MRVIISSTPKTVDGPIAMVKRLTKRALEMKDYPSVGVHKEWGFETNFEFWVTDQLEQDKSITWWVRYVNINGVPVISRHCADEFELLIGVNAVVQFAWDHARR